MILLNTTFGVDANIAADFIEFIRRAYIPVAEASGLYGALLTEVRDNPSENALTHQPVRTFALQMRAPSQKTVDEFRADVVPCLYHEIGSAWGMGVGIFETTLDVIHDPAKK